MDKFLQELTQAHEDAKKNMWRSKDWCGREVVVGEMLGKVLEHMDRYTKIVHTALQHNPDIVSLVWANMSSLITHGYLLLLLELQLSPNIMYSSWISGWLQVFI